MSLVSLARNDLVLGKPLPWPVYDQQGNRLMDQGDVVDSTEKLESLLAARPLRELVWQSANEPASDAGRADQALDEALAGGKEGEVPFADMRLRVGDRIQLQPPAAVSSERFVVKLVGYVEGVSLLVTAPVENGQRVPLHEHDMLIARTFSSQKAFGFKSTVERVCKTPFGYLHLSFPERVQGVAVRKSPRVRTSIIASISKRGGEERYAGMIANLSTDGALVTARQPLAETGSAIVLSFRINLHNVDAYLSVGGIVRAVSQDASAAYSHGVQFGELPPNDSVILQSLIYQEMIERPHLLA